MKLTIQKNPVEIDFVGYIKGNASEKGRMKGILKFYSEEKMEMATNFNEKRPDNFRENSILLTKTK